LAFLVAFGRVASGVHYPSDVLVGMVVGFLSFAVVRRLHHALRRRDLRRPSA
jgi:membrane-associated phospholipid phosphatase